MKRILFLHSTQHYYIVQSTYMGDDWRILNNFPYRSRLLLEDIDDESPDLGGEHDERRERSRHPLQHDRDHRQRLKTHQLNQSAMFEISEMFWHTVTTTATAVWGLPAPRLYTVLEDDLEGLGGGSSRPCFAEDVFDAVFDVEEVFLREKGRNALHGWSSQIQDFYSTACVLFEVVWSSPLHPKIDLAQKIESDNAHPWSCLRLGRWNSSHPREWGRRGCSRKSAECSLRKKRKSWPAEGSQVYSKSLEGSHSSLSRLYDRVSLKVRPLCRAPKPKLFRLCLAFPGVSTTSRLFCPGSKEWISFCIKTSISP